MTAYDLTLHLPDGPVHRTVDADNPADLAAAVHRHARGALGSSRCDVELDADGLSGPVRSHGIVAGMFAIEPATVDEPRPVDTSAADHIRHGYTLRDINYLTRGALILDRWRHAADIEERTDAVRHAIVEHLLTATEPPTRSALIGTGLAASSAVTADLLHHYGYDTRRPGSGAGAMRGFQRYWTPTPGPAEERIVEHIALGQILERLTPRQRQLLAVLAASSTHQQAATASGYTPESYKVLLSAARRKFIRLWHEHETPARRRRDRRVHAADGTWHGRRRLTASEVEALRERRRTSGTTVKALAAEVGLSAAAMSALLAGRTRPALDTEAA